MVLTKLNVKHGGSAKEVGQALLQHYGFIFGGVDDVPDGDSREELKEYGSDMCRIASAPTPDGWAGVLISGDGVAWLAHDITDDPSDPLFRGRGSQCFLACLKDDQVAH